jgi:uncharacterized protein YdgA (DUF945 family)
MKKLLSIFVFLFVPLMIVVPGYMGWQTQRYMESMADYIDSLPGYSANWQEYKRGWFDSSGVLNVVLKDVNTLADSPDVALPFNVQLAHGPVLTGEKAGLGWFNLQVSLLDKDETHLQKVLSVTEVGPIYQLNARMSLQGETAIEDRWLPFQYSDGDFQLTAQAYRGVGRVGVDRVFTYRFEVPSVTFEDDADATVLFKRVSGDVSVDLAKLQHANVAPGTFKFGVGELLSKNQGDATSAFSAKDISVNGETWLDEAETLFGTRSTLQLKSFSIPSAEIDVQNVVLDIAYENINLAFIEQYQNIIATAPKDADASFWQEQVGLLVIQQLLPSSPSISLESLTFETAAGRFSTETQLSIEGDAVASANLSPQNPMAVLPFLIFNLKADADEGVVKQLVGYYVHSQMAEQEGIEALTKAEKTAMVTEQVEQLIGLMLSQQFITFDNSHYKMAFDYKKGQALLNGQPMPMPF